MKRPTLTQREAAAACGVSRSTIRRRREAGELPGAFEDPNLGWLIPVEALLAAGFRLNAPTGPDPVPAEPAPAAEQPDADHAEDDDQDVATLRAELARTRGPRPDAGPDRVRTEGGRGAGGNRSSAPGARGPGRAPR